MCDRSQSKDDDDCDEEWRLELDELLSYRLRLGSRFYSTCYLRPACFSELAALSLRLRAGGVRLRLLSVRLTRFGEGSDDESRFF